MSTPDQATVDRVARAIGKYLISDAPSGTYSTTPAPALDYEKGFGEPIAGTLVMAFDGNINLMALARIALTAAAPPAE